MPKSKKKKNKDFQKVKLKVGKRLPKADNETRTSFKAITIQVPQQLKEAGTEPTTKRKLSLTDLLSQLQHYSASVRHSAVVGLRELLTTNSTILLSNLSGIVVKISELFVDKDPAVRQAVNRLLKMILPQLSTNQISPFFSVISAHLCCAMTHIFEDICQDSLPLLDVFLENFPSLVTSNSKSILQNFMEQISNPKNPGRIEGGRSLSLNPTRKMSSIKWRVGVLERLQKFLAAMSVSDVSIPSLKGSNSQVTYGDIENMARQPLSSGCLKAQTSYTYLLSSNRGDTLSSNVKEPKEELMDFVNNILPLLLECWVEATTSENKGHHSSPDGLVSPDSLVVMVNVVKVIQLLWKFLQTNCGETVCFPDDFNKGFHEQLLGNFPYSVLEVFSRKEKKNISGPKDNKETVLSLNLAVCDIMTYFQSDLTSGRKFTKESSGLINSFLLSSLRGERLSQDNLQCMIRVVRNHLVKADNRGHQREIIQCCHHLYLNAHPMSFEKRALLEFLSELELSNQFISVDKVLQSFLSELPSLLSDYSSTHHQMAALILQIIAEAQLQNKLTISKKDLISFLDLEKGVLLALSNENKHKLLEILYRVESLDTEILRSVTKIINSASISEELSCHLIELLSHRYVNDLNRQEQIVVCDLSSYLSFLTTLVIGMSREELLTPDPNLTLDLGGHKMCISEESLAKWKRQQSITTVSLTAMSHLPQTEQVRLAMEAFLLNILIAKKSWNSHSGWALLECVNTMHGPISEPLTNALVNIGLSLLHLIYSPSSEFSNPEALLHFDNFKSCVWKTVFKFLTSCDKGLQTFLVRFQQGYVSKDLSDRNGALILLTSIVKDLDLLTETDVDLVLLANVSEAVLAFPESVDKQLLVDLKYHSSLVKKSHSNMVT